MALRYAVASGNWSAVGTWNGGASVPGNGDTVVANGYTVTIDQNVTIGGANNPSVNAGSFVTGCWYQITTVGTTSFTGIGASANTVGIVFQATGAGSGTGTATALATLTTAAAGSAVAGGGFSITTAYTLAADIRAGTTTCVTLTGSANVTWTPLNIIGGIASNSYGLNNNATAGTLTMSGVNLSGGTGTNAIGINNNSTANISISTSSFSNTGYSYSFNNNAAGSASFSSCTISSASYSSIVNIAGGSITITGSTISGSANYQAIVNNNASGNLTMSGCTITGGGTSSNNGPGVQNSSYGTCSITNTTFNASSLSNAIYAPSTLSNAITLQGSQYDHVNGTAAVCCSKYKIGTTPSLMQYRKALDGSSTYLTLYTSDFSYFGNPAASDVRYGVSFGSGLTGTCYVPAASSVASGVNVDNTTGTAVLTAAAVQSALTAQGYTTTRAGYLDTLNGLVSAIWSAATRTLSAFSFTVSTNDATPIAAIKAKTDNLPASPAPAGDTTGLTALGYTATRAGYLDTLNGLVTAIWSATTRTLSAFSFTVNTASDANVTAIKAKTDNLPSDPASNTQVNTRLAASGYTAPDNTSVAAIKAKTDNLPASPAPAGDQTGLTAYGAAKTTDIPTSNIAAIKAKTDNLPASPAPAGDTSGLTAYGASKLTSADVTNAVLPIV